MGDLCRLKAYRSAEETRGEDRKEGKKRKDVPYSIAAIVALRGPVLFTIESIDIINVLFSLVSDTWS